MIIDNAGNIRRIQKTEGPDGTDQLYVMNDEGVDEYWWHPGQTIHGSNIYQLKNPVAMEKVLEPDGTQELYVANTAYAYRNWWGDGKLHLGEEIMYIPQADITSLDFSRGPDGIKRLYVGRQRDGVLVTIRSKLFNSSWSLGLCLYSMSYVLALNKTK